MRLDRSQYVVQANRAATAHRSPSRLHTGVPLDPNTTSTTPPRETAVHDTSCTVTRSPNRRPATVSVRAGWSAARIRTSVTLLSSRAVQNKPRFPPNGTPLGGARLVMRQGRGQLVHRRAGP